jgi:membrane protease YdiL (CAAX protease family)
MATHIPALSGPAQATTFGQGWIRRHSVIAYFVLAYAISWVVWTLAYALGGGQLDVLRPFVFIGAFGPPFAAMAAAALTDPTRVQTRLSHQLGLFVASAAAFAVVLLLAQTDPRMASSYLSTPLVNAVSVLLAALIVTGHLSGVRGVRELLRPLGEWRVGARWYLAALFLFPALVLLGNAFWLLLGNRLAAPPYQPDGLGGYLYSVVVIFCFITIYGGALKEEPGWRGFAQRQLQARHSPLVVSIVIGVIWSVWHAPLHMFGYFEGGLATLGLRLVINTLSAIVYTWMYNRTRGSLIPVILLHGSNNTMSVFLPISAGVYLVAIVFTVGLVFVERMWQPLRADRQPIAPLVLER